MCQCVVSTLAVASSCNAVHLTRMQMCRPALMSRRIAKREHGYAHGGHYTRSRSPPSPILFFSVPFPHGRFRDKSLGPSNSPNWSRRWRGPVTDGARRVPKSSLPEAARSLLAAYTDGPLVRVCATSCECICGPALSLLASWLEFVRMHVCLLGRLSLVMSDCMHEWHSIF